MKKGVINWFQDFSAHLEKRRQEFDKSQKEQEAELHLSQKVTPTPQPKEKIEIDVSIKTVIKVVLIIALFLAAKEMVVEIKNILVMTFVCAILVIGIAPMLDKIEKYKISRPLAIIILYVAFFGILTIFFIQLVPIVIKQLTQITYDLREFLSQPMVMPIWLSKFGFNAASVSSLLENNISTIAKNLQSFAGSTFSIVGSIFSSVVTLIITLIFLFFMFLEREKLGISILHLFPVSKQKNLLIRTRAAQSKMAEWFRGQFILMVIVGLFVYIWMSVLHFTMGFEYAVTVAILAAFAEMLPYVGPFLTYLLVGLIGIEISWSAFVIGIACVAMTQFLEGNFLVPIVMRRAVGISSVVIILALLIGASLGYAIGGIGTAIVSMIFSVPIAATIAMFLDTENNTK